jgi:ABC-2 type transport system ATP-binding protein
MVCDHVQIIDKGKLVFNGAIDVLKKQRIGNKLMIAMRNPPSADEMLKLAGIVESESLPGNLMRVRFADDAAPAEAIVQAAVANNWGLYQIAPDQTSLEDVFVQLTFQEQAVPEPIAA